MYTGLGISVHCAVESTGYSHNSKSPKDEINGADPIAGHYVVTDIRFILSSSLVYLRRSLLQADFHPDQ